MFSVLDEFCMQPRSKSPHEEAKTVGWGEGPHTSPFTPSGHRAGKRHPAGFAVQDPQREGSLTHLLLSSAFHSQAWPPPALPPHFPCLKAPRGVCGVLGAQRTEQHPNLRASSQTLWWQGAGCRAEQRPHCWARPGEQKDSWFPPPGPLSTMQNNLSGLVSS